MLKENYETACQFVALGMYDEAEELYRGLLKNPGSSSARAQLLNDIAVIYACRNEYAEASNLFREALKNDKNCHLLNSNQQLLSGINGDYSSSQQPRIAILSLLFNWPSTGGGTVHTTELAKFLQSAGYAVEHFCASYQPWEIGQVYEPPPHPVTLLDFNKDCWNREKIEHRFSEAVEQYNPDLCIIANSWNFKPFLARAVKRFPYILRYGALENLCPLNNIRVRSDQLGQACNCRTTQLASPQVCQECVASNGQMRGSLHEAERRLSGYGTQEYDSLLRQSLARAKAVFVVNPIIAAMFGPYAEHVEVVPSGFDAARFPEPCFDRDLRSNFPCRILFAGLTDDYIKGFHVLSEAASQLWQERQDFEVVVTAEPPDEIPEWASYVGWQSQQEIPKLMRSCDFLVFPAVAEEALGRSAVEAMGCGLPVVASRIGGLQFVVSNEGSGLLFEAGNAVSLKEKIVQMLDHPEQRISMGRVARKRFEQEFLWETIIESHYRPLLEGYKSLKQRP